VEILISVMAEVSNFADQGLEQGDRDVLIVSKGHAALAYYGVMSELGLIEGDFICSYQKNGSDYPEELVRDERLGIECSTGSLGLGLPYGVGMGFLAKRRGRNRRVFCVVGDGECDEGSVWEAIMFAGQQRLSNVSLIVDFNGLQADGDTKGIIAWDNMEARIESFGWDVRSVDGHDFEELNLALRAVGHKPKAVIARTVKGKGISFMENDFSWHDRVLNKELLKQARMEIGL
jgi:transketolase